MKKKKILEYDFRVRIWFGECIKYLLKVKNSLGYVGLEC